MAEWTSEATEYLEGYLAQVRALARHAGEDGDEIASGLREHIIEKTECETGSLVTLEVLRRTLAEVGAPEAIVADGAVLSAHSNAGPDIVHHGTKPPESPAPADAPQGPAKTSRGIARPLVIGCMVTLFAGALAVSLLVGALVYLQYTNMEKTFAVAAESKAVGMLRRVAAAERQWIYERKHDSDNDGTPDYATLAELIQTKALPDDFGRGAQGGYILNVAVKHSSETDTKKPSFQCSARPLEGLDTPLHTLVITEEDVVRYGAPWGPVYTKSLNE